MRLLGLLMGGALGVVQGYAFNTLLGSSSRLSLVCGRRLLMDRSREDDPATPKTIAVLFVSTIIFCLAVMAILFLPLVALGFLTPELRRTGFFPAWCWMFIVGFVIFLRRLKRQDRFR